MALQVGDRLGRSNVTALLGAGGMQIGREHQGRAKIASAVLATGRSYKPYGRDKT